MLLASCARSEIHCSQKFLDALAQKAASSIERFSPTTLVLLIWALASLRYAKGADVFSRAGPAISSAVAVLDVQQLAMVAWSCGTHLSTPGKHTADIAHSRQVWDLLEAVRPRLVDDARLLTGRGLVMAVQGFARAQYYCSDVFAAVELQVIARSAKTFTPVGLAQLLASFASVKDPGVSLFEVVDEQIVDQVSEHRHSRPSQSWIM